MRKVLFYCCCFAILISFFGCRQKPKDNGNEKASLTKLLVDGVSYLEKLDENLSAELNPTQAESLDMLTEADVSGADINISNSKGGAGFVKRNGRKSIVYLVKGLNEITIAVSPSNYPDNKTIYTLTINKTDTSNKHESSNLKTLKVDDEDVLSRLMDNSVTLEDRMDSVETAKLYVEAHNPSAEITVFNNRTAIEESPAKTYSVDLNPGDNKIHVIVKSEKYGDKLHVINIYRFKQNINLKSFKVNNEEIYDESSDKLKKARIDFNSSTESVPVFVEPVSSGAKVIVKNNDAEISGSGNQYTIPLEHKSNKIEIVVKSTREDRKKTYNITFHRAEPQNNSDVYLDVLKAEDKDILDRLSSDNSYMADAVENNKESLKIEAVCAISGVSVKVSSAGNDCTGSGNIYNVPLKDGVNTILVKMIKGGKTETTYTIIVTRYEKTEPPQSPAADEVTVSVFVADGVNGSQVDGTHLNVYKTFGNAFIKKVLVRNGKAQLNLKKNDFYDFKMEGRKAAYPFYAASDVISYFIDDSRNVVSIVQRPLKHIHREPEAPRVASFKFGGSVISAGSRTQCTSLKNVTAVLHAPCAAIQGVGWGTPYPMLAVGYVPFLGDSNRIQVSGSGINKKNNGYWESTWSWTLSASPVKKDEFDIVIVAYDLAHNRVEYHSRFYTSSGDVTEDSALKVTNLKLELERRPTHSSIYSVGHNNVTGASSHYIPKLLFKVSKSGSHIDCIGFDLYRKCITGGETDFKLVKKYRLKSPAYSGSSTSHVVEDTDGVLEDGKEYEYKVIAYSNNNTKGTLDSSPSVKVNMPKSTVILLEKPAHRQVLTSTEASELGFEFKVAEPSILENAKYMELGLIISNRQSTVQYASKFKYLFNETTPGLYFAVKNDIKAGSGGYYSHTEYSKNYTSYYSGALSELITVDKTSGKITLTKKFLSLNANLATGSTSFNRGETYYWDIVDWGTLYGLYDSYDDKACKIVCGDKSDSNTTVIHYVNDLENGNNAWNGRCEFSIKP